MIKISEWKFSALDGISFFCVRGGRFGINIFIERLKKAMIKLIDTKNITSFWKLIRSENINKRDIEALASVICGWHSYFTIKGSKFLPYYAMNGAVFKKRFLLKVENWEVIQNGLILRKAGAVLLVIFFIQIAQTKAIKSPFYIEVRTLTIKCSGYMEKKDCSIN